MFKKLDIDYAGAAVDKNASRLSVSILVAGLLISLVTALLGYDAHDVGLEPLVTQSIELSGVTNPVTAVLLNFRAYDTLLEIAVLLIVVIAVLPIDDRRTAFFRCVAETKHGLVLSALQRWVAPALVIFAGYLLWAGAYQPGGAFQAGALLAGACVLLFQGGIYRINYTSSIARLLLVIGLIVFVAVGLALIWVEGSLLTYPLEYSSILILLIEACATLSIAVALASLYSSLFDTAFPAVNLGKNESIT
jgi:multisubunit Na+/H+ antiporter MnhB subunit